MLGYGYMYMFYITLFMKAYSAELVVSEKQAKTATHHEMNVKIIHAFFLEVEGRRGLHNRFIYL